MDHDQKIALIYALSGVGLAVIIAIIVMILKVKLNLWTTI